VQLHSTLRGEHRKSQSNVSAESYHELKVEGFQARSIPLAAAMAYFCAAVDMRPDL